MKRKKLLDPNKSFELNNTRSSYWIGRDKNIGSMKKQF